MDFLMTSQKGRLANILDNLGQVVIASTLFQFFTAEVKLSLMGSVAALILWTLAIYIERIK